VSCRFRLRWRNQSATRATGRCCAYNAPADAIVCVKMLRFFNDCRSLCKSSDCDLSLRCSTISQPKACVTDLLQFIEARVGTRAKRIDILVDANDGTAKMLNSGGNTSLTLGHQTESQKQRHRCMSFNAPVQQRTCSLPLSRNSGRRRRMTLQSILKAKQKPALERQRWKQQREGELQRAANGVGPLKCVELTCQRWNQVHHGLSRWREYWIFQRCC
jgi:hypothetical protein